MSDLATKRIFDFTASVVLLVLLSPMLIFAAISIRVLMGAPILFRQRRPGKGGKIFTIYKFRTMTESRDADGQLLPNGSRSTRWGNFLRRCSIDELPELWNVFRGEMSLVGPRPLLEKYLPLYNSRQARRHDVLPGITGWAQVNGRNAIEWNTKLERDVWYVENRSFTLDLKILFWTLLKVLKRDGISQAGHFSTSEFEGNGSTEGVYIVGAGGHGRVILSLLRSLNIGVRGFLDDSPADSRPKNIDGTPVLGSTELLGRELHPRAVLAIGDNQLREKISARFTNTQWVVASHPSAAVDPSATIGEGSVIFAGAVIQARVKIGRHSIINSSASVDHDCEIGDFVHVAPGTHLSGNVRLERGSFLGVGVSALPGVTVGAWTRVAGGATIVHSLPAGVTAIGTPAKARPRLRDFTAPSPVLSGLAPVALSDSDIGPDDIAQVLSVLQSKRLALGPKISEFEKKMAERIGVKHAVAVNSGTAALHLIVKALGIGPGDEVIVPSFTFIASANVILFERAVPIFVDVDPVTRNLDPAEVRRRITPRTKAIMVVDAFGQPANWDAILSIANEHHLKVIDDSCEALGAEYRGKRLGSLGDAATFAFYPNKQITTGEGGMIVTNNSEIASMSRSLLNQGRDESGAWLHHVRMGYNYRMDEMSAALGISQLAKLDSIVTRRAQVADWYTQALKGEPWVRCPSVQPDVKMSWFVYVVEVAEAVDRDRLMGTLAERGIPTRAYFSPVHQQPYIIQDATIPRFQLPVTERLARKTLALPFHTNLDRADIGRVVAELKEAVTAQLGAVRRAA